MPRRSPQISRVSLVQRDHVERGHQLERKVLNVPWDHLGNLEKQKWRVLHHREEKREGLSQKVCRELLEDLEKRVRLVRKSLQEKRKIWENPGQNACRDQLRALENRYEGNDVTCRSDYRWRTYSMSFYCRAGGNPTPIVEWWLKGRKRLSGAKYLVKEGDLVVTNLNYNDTGRYTCVAKNILRSSEASGGLTVWSKKNIFFYGETTV